MKNCSDPIFFYPNAQTQILPKFWVTGLLISPVSLKTDLGPESEPEHATNLFISPV